MSAARSSRSELIDTLKYYARLEQLEMAYSREGPVWEAARTRLRHLLELHQCVDERPTDDLLLPAPNDEPATIDLPLPASDDEPVPVGEVVDELLFGIGDLF